jgi:cation diffusion facilitator family transporter
MQSSDERRLGTAMRKERAALWSIVASTAITVGKGAAGFATGSLALISDAAHSLLDVASTTMTWLAVRAAGKPADEEHHYGHGKLESLAALVQTAFLFVLSGAVAYEGARRLTTGETQVTFSWIAVAVLVVAIVVDAWRWHSLRTIARETRSEALEADALHFSSDLVNSVLVLAALGLAALGYSQADALVAILVSVFIAVAGFRLARRTIDTLLDTAPKGVAEQIRAAAAAVPGVVEVAFVRVRPAGGRVFGEVGLIVPRTLPLDRVTELKRRVTAVVETEIPDAALAIQTEPRALDDETVLERVMLIAAKRRVPVHNVIVQTVDGVMSIGMDLEVDGRMSLGAAHARASKFEVAIREEFGPEIEVDTHIEPLRVSHLTGENADPDETAAIAEALTRSAAQAGEVHDVHSVRVRRTPSGLVVTYHCRVDPALGVADVHARVDTVERALRAAFPNVLRVVGHAEPARPTA